MCNDRAIKRIGPGDKVGRSHTSLPLLTLAMRTLDAKKEPAFSRKIAI